MSGERRRRPDFELLEARHIDGLADAVRALNATLVRVASDERGREKALLDAVERIAKHTEGIPALLEALRERLGFEDEKTDELDIRDVG